MRHPVSPDVSEPELRMEIHTSFENLSEDRERWDTFVANRHGEIYHSLDWCRVWWKHYGGDRELHILLFKDREGFVAILPFLIDSVGLPTHRIRVAKLAVSDYTMGTLRPAIQETSLSTVIDRVHSYFLDERECDCVRWGVLTEGCRVAGELESRFAGEGLEVIRVPQGVESVLSLPDRFDTYLRGLSKNHRTNFRRSRNRLVREKGFRVRVIDSADDGCELFDEFVWLHSRQWEAVGEPGHFGDWPGAIEFHREMVRVQGEAHRLLFVCGYSGKEPVSIQYCYGLGDRLTWLLPARRIGADWEKYGLGRVGFVNMVECAIEKGYRQIHLGGAYWRYKADLGGEEEKAFSLIVVPRGDKLRKVRKNLQLYSLFDTLYYKAWFKRIAPRLPWKRSPLWDSWIRGKL